MSTIPRTASWMRNHPTHSPIDFWCWMPCPPARTASVPWLIVPRSVSSAKCPTSERNQNASTKIGHRIVHRNPADTNTNICPIPSEYSTVICFLHHSTKPTWNVSSYQQFLTSHSETICHTLCTFMLLFVLHRGCLQFYLLWNVCHRKTLIHMQLSIKSEVKPFFH